VLLFAMSAESVGKRLIERIGQCVLTCPTTACYNGLDAEQTVVVGGLLRYFGDGYQISKQINGRRLWRVPVMDGEFVVDERFGVQAAVGGGNLLLLGPDSAATLLAAQAAVAAMRKVPGIILPFPEGVVRSGSKPGSRYKSLLASTNQVYCPTLRGCVDATSVLPEAGCVLEIVIDGLEVAAVETAMRVGMKAASQHGLAQIAAGNYGGNLGQYKIALHGLLTGTASAS
jgi:formylmethanofuran--tetrahydromethanopterin N-formyltransferase